MALTLMMIGIAMVVLLFVAMLGGIGLVTSLFGGLISIPSFVWIALIVVIIFMLIGRRK